MHRCTPNAARKEARHAILSTLWQIELYPSGASVAFWTSQLIAYKLLLFDRSHSNRPFSNWMEASVCVCVCVCVRACVCVCRWFTVLPRQNCINTLLLSVFIILIIPPASFRLRKNWSHSSSCSMCEWALNSQDTLVQFNDIWTFPPSLSLSLSLSCAMWGWVIDDMWTVTVKIWFTLSILQTSVFQPFLSQGTFFPLKHSTAHHQPKMLQNDTLKPHSDTSHTHH